MWWNCTFGLGNDTIDPHRNPVVAQWAQATERSQQAKWKKRIDAVINAGRRLKHKLREANAVAEATTEKTLAAVAKKEKRLVVAARTTKETLAAVAEKDAKLRQDELRWGWLRVNIGQQVYSCGLTLYKRKIRVITE